MTHNAGNEYFEQKERIERIVHTSFPGADLAFDRETFNLKFVLRKKGADLLLTDILNWHPTEAAKMKDEEIAALIMVMAAGRL